MKKAKNYVWEKGRIKEKEKYAWDIAISQTV